MSQNFLICDSATNRCSRRQTSETGMHPRPDEPNAAISAGQARRATIRPASEDASPGRGRGRWPRSSPGHSGGGSAGSCPAARPSPAAALWAWCPAGLRLSLALELRHAVARADRARPSDWLQYAGGSERARRRQRSGEYVDRRAEHGDPSRAGSGAGRRRYHVELLAGGDRLQATEPRACPPGPSGSSRGWRGRCWKMRTCWSWPTREPRRAKLVQVVGVPWRVDTAIRGRDEQQAVIGEHPAQFVETGERIVDVLDRLEAGDEVEAPVPVGPQGGLRRRCSRPHTRARACSTTSGIDVEGVDRVGARGGEDRCPEAASAGGVEHSAPRRQAPRPVVAGVLDRS